MSAETTPEKSEVEALKKGVFTGEEGGDERATPESDLAASIVLAIFAILAIAFAVGLDSPNTIWTAPGLFPIITGVTLLAMAVGLGLKARQQGAQLQFNKRRRWLVTFMADEENRRGGILIMIIAAYVLAVDWFGFDWRHDLGFMVLRFSSYELFSMIALTIVLRFFWKATWFKCGLVAVAWALALASVFRLGFHILLPGSG